MSEEKPSPHAEARAEEAAAIRRRWITLGEGLAVIAVVISALTLWNSWSERSDSRAEKAQEEQKAGARATRLTLTGQASSDVIALRPASADQTIQAQTIRFPTALALDPVETTGEPRIEAGWFAAALKRAREKAGLPDDSRGDARIPVLVETTFLADGEAHIDRALYDIGYSIEGRWLRGHSVTLRGLSLATRGADQRQLDARWLRLVPTKK